MKKAMTYLKETGQKTSKTELKLLMEEFKSLSCTITGEDTSSETKPINNKQIRKVKQKALSITKDKTAKKLIKIEMDVRIKREELDKPEEKPPPPHQTVQVRRSTRSSAAKNINLAFMILQILLMLAGCYTKQVEIKEEFLLCDRLRSQYIDIEAMCDLNIRIPEKIHIKDFDRVFNNTDPELNRTAMMLFNKYKLPTEPSQYQFYYDDRWPLPQSQTRFKIPIKVLSQLNDAISGTATECRAEIRTYTLNKDWYGNKLPAIEKREVKSVTASQCQALQNYRLCGMETMECAGNRCRNKEPNLDEMYSYYGPTVVEHRSCEIKFTHISAENPESIVFNSNCRVKDQHCQMPDSCLIWNLNKIKNSCPYETLLETNVDLEANIKDKTVLVSHTDRIAFQIRRKTKTCNNLDVYETTENLYLTIIRAYDSWEGHKLAKGNSMIENQIKLLESEADYRQATAANTFKEMDKRSCFELKNNIQTIADTVHDDFRTITDAKGKKLQIYAYAGNIYLPECERGYKITDNSTYDCKTAEW